MSGIIFTIIPMLLVFILVYFSLIQPELNKTSLTKKDTHIPFMILIAVGFILRIIGTVVYKGHSTDMNCFTSWASMAFNGGLSNFYKPNDSSVFTDYPPGYMYVLYLLGGAKNLFKLDGNQMSILVRLPAIICDLITTYIIYNYSRKHIKHSTVSLIIAAFYLFNPAVYLNSALWGQVDSVFTMFVILMIILIMEKKLIPAYFMFGISIFIKPQALIFTPILIFGIIEHVFLHDFSKEKFIKNLLSGLLAIGMMFVLALPFGVSNVIHQYTSTISSYPHPTINAFNIWYAFGQNWKQITPAISAVGTAFIVIIVLVSAVLFFKAKHESKYFFLAAFLSFGTFMLSARMHDRYAFPIMALFLLTFISLPNTKIYMLYVLSTLAQFFNTAYILFIYESNPGAHVNAPAGILASFLSIGIYVFMIVVGIKLYYNNEFSIAETITSKNKKVGTNSNNVVSPKINIQPSEKKSKLTRIDVIAMIVITAVYAGIAIHDLGDMHAPQSDAVLSNSETLTVDLGEKQEISKIEFFLGSYHLYNERSINISFDTATKNVTNGSVFAWNKVDTPNTKSRYIKLSAKNDDITIREFAIFDKDGNIINPVSTQGTNADNLFDEQSMIPEHISFRNSSYFDEIYHARTGYEFIHSLEAYEWTHPPLGKLFISIGIMIFGMVPFGWRIVGTVFGIFMVPVIYMFAKRLFKHSWLAIITCLLFTFDFMHFAQTRISTIDVYVTFFIMLMYYFMYRYCSMSFYDTSFKKTLIPLGLSGIFMGLGIASKWTGVYAGIGLAVLFFMNIYTRYKEYKYALRNRKGETNGIKHEHIINVFPKYTKNTIIFCVIFFIAIPLVIYGLSYIPYLQADGMNGIKSIIENQESMLTYHGKTVVDSTHPYSSPWYQWPIMVKPIWYFSGTLPNGLKEGISSFGNPAVWWAGIGAFVYLIYLSIAKKDKKALFLVISYLAQLVSWIPVTRITFIYHYFPCVPFIVLMIGYSILNMYNNSHVVLSGIKLYNPKTGKRNLEAIFLNVKTYAIVYAIIAVVLFALFYPVLSGQPIDPEYVKSHLRWFDSWVLI